LRSVVDAINAARHWQWPVPNGVDDTEVFLCSVELILQRDRTCRVGMVEAQGVIGVAEVGSPTRRSDVEGGTRQPNRSRDGHAKQ
jgi:hypothetical protein